MATTYSEIAGGRFVPGFTGTPTVFLHLRLVEVAPATDQLVARGPLQVAEVGVVAVVVLLDDLEGPPATEDVPPDELPLDALRELVVPGVAQLRDGVAEGQVSGPG